MTLSPLELWSRCMEFYHSNVNEQQYETWFLPTRFVSYDAATMKVIIAVPTHFFYEYMEDHFRKLLIKGICRYFGEGTKLLYKVGVVADESTVEESEEAPFTDKEKNERLANVSPTLINTVSPLPSQLNSHQNFDNFIEGASNRLPRSVGQAIAEHPEQQTFNPLFIYGPSGVGKTHLANAIGVRIKQLYPQKRVLYLSALLFQVQYTDSVRRNTFNDFMHFYQSIDVLIIDDIQEFAGHTGTQNAFFHIFNHLHQNGRKIILTSDRPPVALQSMADRLLTRFKWGLLAELERPDADLRRSILESKIRRDGLVIPQDVIDYISENVSDNVRELEGIVHSLLAYSVVLSKDVDLELAQQIMKRNVHVDRAPITIDQILDRICDCCNVRHEDVCGKSRKSNIVEARQLSIWLAQKYTKLNNSRIGTLIGNRDHATVIHSIKTIDRRLKTDGKLKDLLQEIETKLKNPV